MNRFNSLVARVRRRARIATVAVAVSGLLVGLAGSPAQASVWSLQDSFDTDGVWSFGSVGVTGPYSYSSGFGGIDHYSPTTHSGKSSGYVDLLDANTGYVWAGRTVHLTPAQVHSATCYAGIWILPGNGTSWNIEVINPTTWTYLALKSVTLTNTTGAYQFVMVGPWTTGPTDVYFRVALGANPKLTGWVGGDLDDLAVQCSY